MAEPQAGHVAAPPVRVVLADDSVLFREGLARLLDETGFLVAGQAGDASELHAVVAGKARHRDN
jgi:DNA-binding NarL/FixJ family response regulator